MKRFLFFICLLVSCQAQEPAPAPTPPRAFVPSASTDHAIYTTVLRDLYLRPQPGEQPISCAPEDPRATVEILATTQPVVPGTPKRDLGWANELPAEAAPLMAALRAMDSQPRVALDANRLAPGVPVQLVPSAPNHSRLIWFSRVAYTADGNWALVYAVAMCPGVTDAQAANEENGAYERVVLAPLQRRGGLWTLRDPLYLDIGMPTIVTALPLR
jgi:hypothetical protein